MEKMMARAQGGIRCGLVGLVILAVLLVAGPVAAMERYADWLQDQAGNALSGVTVTVRNNTDASLATIYASDSITDVKANPFTNGSDGAVVFYAQVGRYNLVFTKANFTFNADDTKDIILGVILDNSTKANLPAAGTAGRLARVTDNVRGVWMDQGTQWFGLSGEIINVKEFGATGDGVTDDTTAIQNAINAASAGGIIFFPSSAPNFYKVTAAFTITNRLVLRGAGQTAAVIKSTSATLNLIEITSPATQPVTVQDLTLGRTVTATAGAGIKVSNTGFSVFERIDFDGQFTGIQIETGSSWNRIHTNTFQNTPANGFGVIIRNTAAPDAGENWIVTNAFNTASGAGATAILWQSGGGLRIIGNKFLPWNIHLNFTTATGVVTSTSQIQIIGNSFDGPTARTIIFANANAGDLLTDVLIASNEFRGGPSSPVVEIGGSTTSIFQRFSIIGNILQRDSGTASGLTIGLMNGLFFGANVWNGLVGATGILINSGAVGITLGDNVLAGWTTPINNGGDVARFTNRKSILTFGDNIDQAQNTTAFYGSFAGSTDENRNWVALPFKSLVTNLRLGAHTVPAVGQTAIGTIRKNIGSDTALTATITNADSSASDLVNQVVFVAGDKIDLKVVLSATSGNLSMHATVQIEEIP